MKAVLHDMGAPPEDAGTPVEVWFGAAGRHIRLSATPLGKASPNLTKLVMDYDEAERLARLICKLLDIEIRKEEETDA